MQLHWQPSSIGCAALRPMCVRESESSFSMAKSVAVRVFGSDVNVAMENVHWSRAMWANVGAAAVCPTRRLGFSGICGQQFATVLQHHIDVHQ